MIFFLESDTEETPSMLPKVIILNRSALIKDRDNQIVSVNNASPVRSYVFEKEFKIKEKVNKSEEKCLTNAIDKS